MLISRIVLVATIVALFGCTTSLPSLCGEYDGRAWKEVQAPADRAQLMKLAVLENGFHPTLDNIVWATEPGGLMMLCELSGSRSTPSIGGAWWIFDGQRLVGRGARVSLS